MLLDVVLAAITLLLLLPAVIVCGEIFASYLPRRSGDEALSPRPNLAVLIPAHNEALGLAATLASVRAQLAEGDRLLVVADNCTDATAQIASNNEAEVVERWSDMQRGKGFALAAGIEYLTAKPPQVVVFIDADCRLQPGTLTALARTAAHYQRPTQATNLVEAPAGSSSPQHLLSALAFRMKNLVRMRGMSRLGGACHLTGTGMALPWSLVTRAHWATDNLVEDLQLGIDLTTAGFPALYVPEAGILSSLPTSESGMWRQRQRWERGFLATATKTALPLLLAGLRNRCRARITLAADLLVPPVALLSCWLTIIWLGSLCMLPVSRSPWFIATLWNTIFSVAMAVAWYLDCRHHIGLTSLLNIPRYLGKKIELYAGGWLSRPLGWQRAERTAV